MQTSKPLKGQQPTSHQPLQSTYIIYTPKIIKFNYPGSYKRVDQLPHPTPEIKLQTIKCQLTHPNISKKQGQKQICKLSQRKGKLQLTTAKKQFIPLKGNNKTKKNYLGHSPYKNSQGSHNQLVLGFSQNKNHITTTDFIQSLSCDFFSQCNQTYGIDQGQRKALAFDDSRKTIQKNQKINGQVNTANKVMQELQKDKGTVPNFKRKDIFTQNNLNRTFDYATQVRSRRKSIFQQTYLCDLSFSKQRSPSQRKKIFEVLASKKSKSTLKSYQQSLQQTQIPLTILQKWQTFSQQSQADHAYTHQHLLPIDELRLEQSQVQLIG